jgi:hypothetical protein
MDLVEKYLGEETKEVLNADNAELFAERLRKELNAPEKSVTVSTLGGAHRPSVMIRLSLDPKSEWEGGIYQNSRWIIFSIHYPGNKLELVGKSHTIKQKFRKATIKNVDGAIQKINKYISTIK